jgi:CBS domain-containing protein
MEDAMRAADIMTRTVITVAPDASIRQAVRLMLQHKISGLPVVDAAGRLVGMVTEGDFLRRVETGTERKRTRWIELFTGPSRMADDYIRSHGRRIDEVMTRDPVTISADTPLDQVVSLMERHRVKRLPVVADGKVVGIVSRANLVRALASLDRETYPTSTEDTAIRERILAELGKQSSWAPRNLVDVVVRNGTVDLWGVVVADNQRQAVGVLVENIPGVKQVRNHLGWVDPISGTVFFDPNSDAHQQTVS